MCGELSIFSNFVIEIHKLKNGKSPVYVEGQAFFSYDDLHYFLLNRYRYSQFLKWFYRLIIENIKIEEKKP